MIPQSEQTDTHAPRTPLEVRKYADLACFAKAMANGEEIFCLRSQDITAPLVIDFWIKVQQHMENRMAMGMTELEAVKSVRAFYFLDEPDVPTANQKLAQACAVAGAMEDWPHRKLAD